MIRNCKHIFIAVFIIFFFQSADAQTITRQSYLQDVTPSSIVIKLKTSTGTRIQICYGENFNTQNTCVNSALSSVDHEVTLNGLDPATTYFYHVNLYPSGNTLQAASTSLYFKSAPELGSRQPVRAWILGDSGDGVRNDRDDVRVVRDKFLEYGDANGDADLVLFLGDNAYGYNNEPFGDGEDQAYQVKLFDIFEDILQSTPSYSCIGNHDADPLSGQSGPYFDIFALPSQSSGNESYYSFDYGNIHFLVLDSERTDRRVNSPMFSWAQMDLANTTQEWIVAFWHHPPYSKNSSHDSDSEGRLVDMRQNFLPMLEDYGVDLVLSGHSHSYSRSKYVNNHYGNWNSFNEDIHVVGDNGATIGQTDQQGAYQKDLENEQGTVYVVTGSSSKTTPLQNEGQIEWNVMRYRATRLGSTILETDKNRMDIKFLNANGDIEDDFTIFKGAPEIDILTPNVYTHFESGDVMTIDWTDNSDENLAIRLQNINNVSSNVPLFTPVSIPKDESEYAWTIPSTIEPGIYRVRIGGNTNHAKNSDWFPIDTFYVNVLSPNFGDNFSVGETINVQYTTNITNTEVSQNANKLRMRYLIGEGNDVSIVFMSDLIDPNDQNYSFQIPPEAQNQFCRIKFMYTISGHEVATHYSEPFRVGDPVPNDIAFTSPAPNSSYDFGQILNLEWEDQIPYKMRMNLYKQTDIGGIFLDTLPDMEPEISSFNFVINDHISEPGLYKVKLAWNIGGQTQASALSEIFSVGSVASNLRSINNSGKAYVLEKTPDGTATHLKGDFTDSQVCVINADGEVVKQYNNQQATIFIDHEKLPMGLHMLKVQSLSDPNLVVETILKSY